jgi:uncharacterized protein YecE (DUF72 family)
MKLYVGTSGYSYKQWKGKFYPKGLPESRMLHYYGQQFRAVEINHTFLRMPKASLLKTWATEVPADFMFALKSPQRITHFQRLKTAGTALSELVKVSGALRNRLGPLLFQLPSNFKKDASRLREFLAKLRRRRRAAFEFRHASWFDDEVFELLHDRQAALCFSDEFDDLKVPSIVTAKWGYLRLRRTTYGDKSLKDWVKRVRKQEWNDAFVFFKHEDEATGPTLATRFVKLAG